MTALSRPVRAMLESVFDAPPLALDADIDRLRLTLTAALRRCLDAPEADWNELIELGAVAGEWDEWRVAGLRAAVEPGADLDPALTRDTLAQLVEELIGRGDVVPGPWEGGARQEATDSAEWLAGRRRREMIFAIERAMVGLAAGDAACLRDVAERIVESDEDETVFPGLPTALRSCADDLEGGGAISPQSKMQLADALDQTPFVASLG